MEQVTLEYADGHPGFVAIDYQPVPPTVLLRLWPEEACGYKVFVCCGNRTYRECRFAIC